MCKAIMRSAAILAIAMALTTPAFSQAQKNSACEKPAEAKKVTIVGDWLPWASQGPIIAAQEAGLYKAEGFDVELISPATPSDPIKLVARQKVAFSMTYPPEIMVSQDTSIPVTSVAAILRTYPWGLVVDPDSGVKTPADLKGKVVGVSSTLAGRESVETMIRKAGLDPKKDVELVSQGYAAVQLLTAGKVVGITGLSYGELVTIQNARKKDNKSAPLFWNFRDYGVPEFYFMVIAGNDAWMKKNPATTCRFLRATANGHGEFDKNRAKYNQIFAKKNEIFPLEEHAGFTDRTMSDWKDKSGVYFKQDSDSWKKAQEWALSVKLITVGSNPDNYFTNKYLP
ncbi:MAG: hypothetical protein EXQ91_03815 [Alphaproteobacteria bacterium]|nr:hypothetical protein [Alphaproteobacteria bacterium]